MRHLLSVKMQMWVAIIWCLHIFATSDVSAHHGDNDIGELLTNMQSEIKATDKRLKALETQWRDGVLLELMTSNIRSALTTAFSHCSDLRCAACVAEASFTDSPKEIFSKVHEGGAYMVVDMNGKHHWGPLELANGTLRINSIDNVIPQDFKFCLPSAILIPMLFMAGSNFAPSSYFFEISANRESLGEVVLRTNGSETAVTCFLSSVIGLGEHEARLKNTDLVVEGGWLLSSYLKVAPGFKLDRKSQESSKDTKWKVGDVAIELKESEIDRPSFRIRILIDDSGSQTKEAYFRFGVIEEGLQNLILARDRASQSEKIRIKNCGAQTNSVAV